MFSKILVPVDLAHIDTLRPALQTAADLARHHGASVCYMSVTATVPGQVARSPEEYADKLKAFAEAEGEQHGQPVTSHCLSASDPVAVLEDRILQAIDDSGADLVVMATHLPGHLDAVMPANGARVARDTASSVFLVRSRGT
jgi:nucleotide-binding universal stress UspA family protein